MSLVFDIEIGLKEKFEKPYIRREAVRAIVIQNNEILMLSSNRGDFKLPGGGLKDNETHIEALYREVEEETGYRCKKVIAIGKVFERKIDHFDKSSIFEMNSYYYICTLEEDDGMQKLTESEKELCFKPEWLKIDEAIKSNVDFLNKNPKTQIWTKREVIVLEEILKNIDQFELI